MRACGAARSPAVLGSANSVQGVRDFDFVEGHLSRLWGHERADLRHEQAVALLVWSATGLIENGGFAALVEALGSEAADVADGFRDVGLPRRAGAVAAGLALFPRYADADPDVRLSLPLSRRLGAGARLDKADSDFYALDEEEPVDRAVAGYMQSHPDAFPPYG